MAGLNSEYTSPVFRPLKSRPTVLGMGGAEWGRVILVALASALIAFALGFWTQKVDVPLNSQDVIAATAHYSGIKDDMAKLDSRLSSANLTSYSQLDLSSDEKETIAEAQKYGITSKTSREELESLVPNTKESTVPVFADIPRWFILCLLPTLLVAGINIEYSHGTTLWREAKRIVSNAKAQHIYNSRPAHYIETAKD